MTQAEKNAYQREWNKKNKEKKKEQDRKYREAHKEEIRAAHKAWRDKNRERLNEKQRERYKDDPQSFKERNERYRTSHVEQVKESRHRYKTENRQRYTDDVRTKRQSDPIYRFRTSVVRLIWGYNKKMGYKGNKSTWDVIGCDLETLLDHIQKQFQEGMTLENYGIGVGKWNIDHIIPISTAVTDEDIERLNHYTNLQPMWVVDNCKKSNK